MKLLKRRNTGTTVMLLVAIFFTAASPSLLAQEKESFYFRPFYSLNFNEGANIFSTGQNTIFSTNLSQDLGVMLKLSNTNSLLALYEIKYTGPGIRRQEGRTFIDRYMDHIFFVEHRINISSMVLKSKINYINELSRSGANEAWGYGLYDFNSFGLNERVELNISKFKIYVNGNLSYFSFPNYVDLLSELQRATTTQETLSGQQDNINFSGSIGILQGPWEANLSLNVRNYINQKVISSSLLYSDAKQQDVLFTLFASYVLKTRVLKFSPEVKINIKNSNQNYVHYKYFGDTSPQFVEKYYDYIEPNFILPLTFVISSEKNINISLIPEVDLKFYTARPPRDANNDFLRDTKQYHHVYNLTLLYEAKMNSVTTCRLFYTYSLQSSNNKFEKYIPYNFSAHSLGVSLAFTY